MNKFVFTCGDINGIGPEIVLKTINRIYKSPYNKIYFACPLNVFEEAASQVNPLFRFEVSVPSKLSSSEVVTIINTGKAKINKGTATKDSGKAAFKSIRYAYDMVSSKKADAIITAPISKTAIHKAGYNFPGHTEMLAEWCNAKNFVMMFLSKKMNAALITIHEPVKKIASLITKKDLSEKFEIIIQALEKDLNIRNPRAAVLGLNPHAGEGGIIGKEEDKIIKPAMKKSKYAEQLHGPFSPDAFFANMLYKNYDVVIGMYHDQVLIPFKFLNFTSGVNYTAGLPIVRTSPDHGTAYDIAGLNKADESSIYEAFLYAEIIVKNRKPLIL